VVPIYPWNLNPVSTYGLERWSHWSHFSDPFDREAELPIKIAGCRESQPTEIHSKSLQRNGKLLP